MPNLYLAIDIVNKVLVSYNGSASVLPVFGQTDMVNLQLQFVTPQPGSVLQYVATDVSAQGVVVTMASKVTGVEANDNTYLLAQALQAAFTWDSNNLWYTGQLNVNTTQVETLIGTGSSAPAFFEIDLTTGGVNPYCVLLPSNITIQATAYAAGGTPTPVSSGYAVLALQNGVGGVTIAGTLVTVAGLTWATIPNAVLLAINVPLGKGLVFACYVPGTATLAGFEFQMSGIPDDNTYTFTYIPLF
jgi:hypothetical protein